MILRGLPVRSTACAAMLVVACAPPAQRDDPAPPGEVAAVPARPRPSRAVPAWCWPHRRRSAWTRTGSPAPTRPSPTRSCRRDARRRAGRRPSRPPRSPERLRPARLARPASVRHRPHDLRPGIAVQGHRHDHRRHDPGRRGQARPRCAGLPLPRRVARQGGQAARHGPPSADAFLRAAGLRPALARAARPGRRIARRIGGMGLDYTPGSRTVYSDFGIILLGSIIEELIGQTLDLFLDERVFDPLGMRDTGYNPRSWADPVAHRRGLRRGGARSGRHAADPRAGRPHRAGHQSTAICTSTASCTTRTRTPSAASRATPGSSPRRATWRSSPRCMLNGGRYGGVRVLDRDHRPVHPPCHASAGRSAGTRPPVAPAPATTSARRPTGTRASRAPASGSTRQYDRVRRPPHQSDQSDARQHEARRPAQRGA